MWSGASGDGLIVDAALTAIWAVVKWVTPRLCIAWLSQWIISLANLHRFHFKCMSVGRFGAPSADVSASGYLAPHTMRKLPLAHTNTRTHSHRARRANEGARLRYGNRVARTHPGPVPLKPKMALFQAIAINYTIIIWNIWCTAAPCSVTFQIKHFFFTPVSWSGLALTKIPIFFVDQHRDELTILPVRKVWKIILVATFLTILISLPRCEPR